MASVSQRLQSQPVPTARKKFVHSSCSRLLAPSGLTIIILFPRVETLVETPGLSSVAPSGKSRAPNRFASYEDPEVKIFRLF